MTALLLSLVLAADPTAERSAERAGVVARVWAEPAVVPLTGATVLTLRVEGEGPLAVGATKFDELRGWRVRQAAEPVISTLADGRQRWEQSFRVVPDVPGDVPLPVPIMQVRAGGRSSAVEFAFEPLATRVTTELPRVDVDEARAVTGPEAIPPAPPSAWGLALGGAVLLGLLAVAWQWRRRSPAPAAAPAPADWLDVELARLAALDPAIPAAADALAGAVRGYVARRYRLAEAGRTTAELLAQMQTASLPIDVEGWRALLERCDLAKFARAGFTPVEWADALAALRAAAAPALSLAEERE